VVYIDLTFIQIRKKDVFDNARNTNL